MNAQFNAALHIFLQFLIAEQKWDGKIGKVFWGKWAYYLSHEVEFVFGVHALPLPGPCSSQVVDFVKLSLRRGLQSLPYPWGCRGLGVSSRKISEAFTLIYSFHIFVWFPEPAHLHFCQYFPSYEWRQSWKYVWLYHLPVEEYLACTAGASAWLNAVATLHRSSPLLLQQWQSALADPHSAQSKKQTDSCDTPPLWILGLGICC